jgi:hypothetical protein
VKKRRATSVGEREWFWLQLFRFPSHSFPIYPPSRDERGGEGGCRSDEGTEERREVVDDDGEARLNITLLKINVVVVKREKDLVLLMQDTSAMDAQT